MAMRRGVIMNADTLKEMRVAANLSQARLGALTGIHDTSLCRYEAGLRIPERHREKLIAVLKRELARAEKAVAEARTALSA
jgi:transcriptional regulator with XRE-family HTH domain